YVTNSVHYPTWIANEWHQVFYDAHGNDFVADQANKARWKQVDKLSDKEVTDIRQTLKQKLIAYTKKTMQEDMTKRGENPRQIFKVVNNIDENAMVFGFARRFATYKRAHLLFTNLERLAKIVNDTERPVMFIFSGKAHPADQGGQALIRQINEISKRPEFEGKIIFLENYNMESAKLLVQGVDVWLNTPTRPKEASGTSGMKAAMNGVVNFSVLDGWWAEGYRPDAGWALPLERTYADQEQQNALDAERIYNTLEEEIIPTYFERDQAGISTKWLSYVRTIMGEVAPYFTMRRMMNHYFERFYNKLYISGKTTREGKYANAKRMATWKSQMRTHWKRIETVEVDVLDTATHAINLGEV
ncbi:MAG: alpha-glucan family phosphorylase, partial [Bacteroidota bacterium]